ERFRIRDEADLPLSSLVLVPTPWLARAVGTDVTMMSPDPVLPVVPPSPIDSEMRSLAAAMPPLNMPPPPPTMYWPVCPLLLSFVNVTTPFRVLAAALA